MTSGMTSEVALPTTDLFPGLRPLVHQFMQRALTEPDRIALAVYPAGASRPSATFSWGAWGDATRAAASALLMAGVKHGDRVAVLSRNRPMWPIADMAIQRIGSIGVGIYPGSAPSQITQLLRDADVGVVLLDDLAHVPVVAGALAERDAKGLIVCDVPEREWNAWLASSEANEHAGTVRVQHWEVWCNEGRNALQNDSSLSRQLEARSDAVTLDDIAALIYTSGSTGIPKGACISHRYLAASAISITERLELTAIDRGLSFLPFSHAAERVFGQCVRVWTGMSAALVEEPSDVFRVAHDYQPTLFGGLPRMFERLYEAAELARRDGDNPRDAIVSRIGSRCRLATSGGAAMPVAVADALRQLGLPVVGAYGQTEHLCLAMNTVNDPRATGVGMPMLGTEVRVASDGELLVRRSALTFSGYWRNAAATEAAFTEDGVWLRTGDLVEQDADGFLRIVGRVKELIALSNGRKVAPVPIEAALCATPLIEHAVCFGEGRKYLVALLSLRRDLVQSWAAQELQRPSTWPALVEAPELRAQLQAAVDAVNATLARTDRVQAFAVTEQAFTTQSGELTPTSKIIREVIATRYADTLDRLYA